MIIAFVKRVLMTMADALEELRERNVFVPEAAAAAIEARQIEQIADDLLQPLGLVIDDPEIPLTWQHRRA